jgi:TFIIE beta subunit core domain/TFA2 Winged helix domain 2
MQKTQKSKLAPPSKPCKNPSKPSKPSIPATDHDFLPLGARLKYVIDELKRTRTPLTSDAIRRTTGIDIQNDAELTKELSANERVEVSNSHYSYRPKTSNIRNQADLLCYLQAHTTVEGAGAHGMHGVKWSLLDDAYPGIEADVSTLTQRGRIRKFDCIVTKGDATLFYVEDLGIAVSDEVSRQFHSIKLPENPTALQTAVEKAGLKSWMANRPVLEKSVDPLAPTKKRKKKRAFNVEKATNSHLPELFAATTLPSVFPENENFFSTASKQEAKQKKCVKK